MQTANSEIFGSAKNLDKLARHLRFHPTQAEILLWQHLKNKQLLNIKFFRQIPIGKFIVDFVAPSIKMIIEIDGGQHFDETHKTKDKIRDEFLQKLGYHILRFTNTEVYETPEGVLDEIYRVVQGIRGYQLSFAW